MAVKWSIFIGNDFTPEHRIGAFPTSFSQPIFDQKINFRKSQVFTQNLRKNPFFDSNDHFSIEI